MNKRILETLEKARKLISNPETWTKKTEARTINDRAIKYTDSYAYKFCIRGAIVRAYYEINTNRKETRNIEKHIRNKIDVNKFTKRKPSELEYEYFEDYVHFNDDPKTTHKQILKLLDYSIKLFSKKETNNE